MAPPLQIEPASLGFNLILGLILVVGPSGLEPPTSRLSVVRSSQLSYGPIGGDKRVRTVDPLLAKQVLSQLSYTPIHLQGVRPLN